MHLCIYLAIRTLWQEDQQSNIMKLNYVKKNPPSKEKVITTQIKAAKDNFKELRMVSCVHYFYYYFLFFFFFFLMFTTKKTKPKETIQIKKGFYLFDHRY